MAQAAPLFDRIDWPTVTVDVPPLELLDCKAFPVLLARTTRVRSTLTLPDPPLTAFKPLLVLRLMELSVIATLLVPPPEPVPSTLIPAPVLASMCVRSMEAFTVAPPVGLMVMPPPLLLRVVS